MKKAVSFFTFVFLVVVIYTSCDKKSTTEAEPDPKTVTDIDGNVYNTIRIGNQLWTMENLKVTRYRNGDPIFNLTDNNTLEDPSAGALCAYDNDTNNVAIYGYLYNGFAVEDSRNLAPKGWHVPTDEEWKVLEMHLGMSQSVVDEKDYRGTDEGGQLKETGTVHWNSPNTGATNESKFSALPGGYRYDYDGAFGGLNTNAGFWNSTEENSTHLGYRYLAYDRSNNLRSTRDKACWFSVRLIWDR